MQRGGELLNRSQSRQQERSRSAGGIENGDRVETIGQRFRIAHANRLAAKNALQIVARRFIAVAQPRHDGARGQDVDDRARRVEAAGRQPLVGIHQRLEDFAEHLRIDVRAGGVRLIDGEGEALEDFLDDTL